MMEQTEGITSSVRSEIIIDRPVKAVWAAVFEFPNWAPTVAKAELICGGWDVEGCVMLLTKHEWVGLQPFFSELIRAVPFHQQVYHNRTRNGNQLNGFVDLTFNEERGGTRVIYTNYLTLRFPAPAKTYATPEGAMVRRSDLQSEKAAQKMIEIYLEPLKRYAEGASA